MMLAKIVADLYLKTSNLAPKGKGRHCCATTSHGHNSEKKKTDLSDESQKEGLLLELSISCLIPGQILILLST